MDLQDKSLKLTPKRIEAMHKLGIYDTDALLSYYPYRYDIMQAKPFEDWQIKEKVVFEASVASKISNWKHGYLTTTHFDVEMQDRIIKITIFNRPWASRLKEGQLITIQGIYQGGSKVTATNYDLKPLKDHDPITPVYTTKEGIQQRTIRAVIHQVYETLQNEIYDDIPEKYISHYRLLRKSEALRRIHFPSSESDVISARRTLKYEEFLHYFTSAALIKEDEQYSIYKQPVHIDEKKVQAMIASLPFELTRDQKQALQDIFHDMSSTHPMYRLIQGDVGCGKTAVAALALYACAESGRQGALLAPTEILARQHYDSLTSMFHDTSLKIEVLYSGLSKDTRSQILEDVKDGTCDILIGTHALLQEDVIFHDPGLVVADEQQRFGVEQRKALRMKGNNPDFLLMSATPIPRTLASALYGDMDISTIETMPEGRITPETKLIEENSFRSVLQDVEDILHKGHQLYVICAAVDKNEDYHARNVQDTANALTKLFKSYRVAMLHGRMSSEEKETVMKDFADNKTQVLVSTTVVEVGMNVVNATGMIIYDADRFGLSQLHQLRGRIQRGNEKGHCWLLTDSKDPAVKERLNVLVKSNNGFEISYEDLRLRGPGDILGTRQSGLPDFMLGNLTEDTNMIHAAQNDAKEIVQHSDNPDFMAIIEVCRKRNTEQSRYID